MSRRLPVYFLIDVSESMVGEPMREVEEGMATIIKELKTDPNAIETAWISVVVFAGNAKTLVPLQEIVQFYPPRFPVGSGTSLSKGLGQFVGFPFLVRVTSRQFVLIECFRSVVQGCGAEA